MFSIQRQDNMEMMSTCVRDISALYGSTGVLESEQLNLVVKKGGERLG